MSHTTPDTTYERDLKAAIEGVETCLLTPLVSGELEAWSQGLQQNWARLMLELERHVLGMHRQQFKNIASQDTGLLNRVAQLASEDSAIMGEAEVLGRLIAKLAIEGDPLEPKEIKAREDVKEVAERGISLLTRIRAQEVAIAVWLSEALNRDDGVGD